MILLAVIAVLFLVDIIAFSNDMEWQSGCVSLVVMILGWWFWPPLQVFVATHSFAELAIYIAGYLGIGVSVSFIKWIFFNLGIASKLRELKTSFSGEGSFYNFVGDTFGISNLLQTNNYSKGKTLTESFTPRAKNYVDRFTIWTLQWPVVIVDMVASEFIVKIGKHVASLADALFSSVGKILIGSAVKDLK